MSVAMHNAGHAPRKSGKGAMGLWLLGALPGGFSVALFIMLALGIEGHLDAEAFPAAFHFATPLPVIIHAGGGIVFWVLAPVQFLAGVRNKHKELHRLMGTVLALSAISMGVGALWLLHTYSGSTIALKYWGMMTLSLGLFATVGFGIRAILRGDRAAHGVWMMRLSAFVYVGMTRIFFEAPLGALLSEQSELNAGVSIWLALILNLGFVEYRRSKKLAVRRKGELA